MTTKPQKAGADVLPVVLIGLALIGVTVGHYLTFSFVPMEKTMGPVQRIFYFHVPSAMAMYAGFLTCFVASIVYLYNRKTRADLLALSAAEVGLLFGALVLVTGPLWARGAWGVWWKWEPRLTTLALLYLIFAAYWVLRKYGGSGEGVRRFAAVLAVFGAPNMYFVRIAVKKWRGDHPDGVTSEGGMHPDMRMAFMVCLAAVLTLFTLLLIQRYRAHRDAATASALRRRLGRMGGMG